VRFLAQPRTVGPMRKFLSASTNNDSVERQTLPLSGLTENMAGDCNSSHTSTPVGFSSVCPSASNQPGMGVERSERSVAGSPRGTEGESQGMGGQPSSSRLRARTTRVGSSTNREGQHTEVYGVRGGWKTVISAILFLGGLLFLAAYILATAGQIKKVDGQAASFPSGEHQLLPRVAGASFLQAQRATHEL